MSSKAQKARSKSTSFDLPRTSTGNVKKLKRNSSTMYLAKDKNKPKKGAIDKKSSKTVSKKPFIPPPGKTSPGRPMSWESKSHRLEINPPSSSITCRTTMHVDELSTTEVELVKLKKKLSGLDEEVRDPSQRYEHKIAELLNDVSLSERHYVQSKTDEQLNASRKLIEDQEHEILNYRSNLNTSMRDYSKLRQSIDMKDKEIEMSRNEAEMLGNEKENLLKKLMLVENEGRRTSRELHKLRDTCQRLQKDQKFSEQDIETVTSQRDMLLAKLKEFEDANKKLKSLLREAQKQQALDGRLSDRCDILVRKLTSAEAKLQDQTAQLIDQDQQIEKLIAQVDKDKHQVKIFEDMQATMETTRGQLDNQLMQKESECNRFTTIINKLELDFEGQKHEIDEYQRMLSATRDKSLRDKEALKKATRVQRERAQKHEDDNESLQRQVTTLITELEHAKVTMEDLTSAHNQLKTDKQYLEQDFNVLSRHVVDIGDTLELSAKTMKSGPVHISERLVSKIRSLKSVKLENANLKDELKTLEDNLHSNDKEFSFKLRTSDVELSKLRATLAQFEELSSDYKTQMERYRHECDNLHGRLRKQDDEMNKRIKESMIEVNSVRTTLQSKILELEPYPELLKTSEIRLKESEERATMAEKKLLDHGHIIAELTQKIELQTEQLDHIREKYRSKHDECRHLDQQMQTIERQMESADGSQRELIQSLSRKDENLNLLQEKFDAQRIENERLVHQLEVALADAQKQADAVNEKSYAKERSAQARILDLEGQLTRSTQNTQLLKRSKEEAERKFNSRLQDMRDRLEQANTTTRSMQSYVQFLKSTYANVFTDAEYDYDQKY